MDFLLLGAWSVFVSFMAIVNPVVRNAMEAQNLPLQITGLKDSLDCLAMLIIPDYYDANQVSAHWLTGDITPPNETTIPLTTTTTKYIATTATATVTVTATKRFQYDAALSYWENAQEWFKEWVESPINLEKCTHTVLILTALFYVIMQWRRYRTRKQDQEYFHKLTEAKIDGLYQAALEQKGLTQQQMNSAAQELREKATNQVDDFKKDLAGLHKSADEVMEAVEQVEHQVQEQLDALKPQGHLHSLAQEFETGLANMKDTAKEALEKQSENLQAQFQTQVAALKPQEQMENLAQEFKTQLDELKNTAIETTEDIKQLRDKFQDQADKLQSEERIESLFGNLEQKMDSAASFATQFTNDEAALLQQERKKIQDRITALGQQEENLKAQQQQLDTSLKEFRESANDAMGAEVKCALNAFRTADWPLLKKKYEESLDDQNNELNDRFRNQVRESFRQNFSKDAFDRLIKEVLTEQLQSALPGDSSGDLASFLQQKFGEAVKEHTGSQLHSTSSTSSTAPHPQGSVKETPKIGLASPTAPWANDKVGKNEPKPQEKKAHEGDKSKGDSMATTFFSGEARASPGLESSHWATQAGPVLPQGNVEQTPKSPGVPSPSLQKQQPASPAGPASSAGSQARKEVREARRSSKGDLQGSMHAPSPSPTFPQPRDKDKQPMRVVPGSSEGDLQGSMHAPSPSPTFSQPRDKGKQPMRVETRAVPEASKGDLQGSMHAPSPSPTLSQPQDKCNLPIRSGSSLGSPTGPADSAQKADEHGDGKKVSGVQGSKGTSQTPNAPLGTATKKAPAKKAKGGAKEPVPKKPSTQPAAEGQGSSKDHPTAKASQSTPKKTAKASTGAEKQVQDPQTISSVIQNLRPIPQTASVPSVSETEFKPLRSVQEGQKDDGKVLQDMSSSRYAHDDIPDTPKPPAKKEPKRPLPRAGLVEENFDNKNVGSSSKASKWPPVNTNPRKQVEASAPVQKDQTKVDAPGPAKPKRESISLFSVRKGKAKEAASPAEPPKEATKSKSWSDMVDEDESASAQGSSGANQPTGVPATAAATKLAPLKTAQKASSGVSQSSWAPKAEPESPNPPAVEGKEPPLVKDAPKKGDNQKVSSPGLVGSKWADPEPVKEAAPKSPAEKETKGSSGLGESRWAS